MMKQPTYIKGGVFIIGALLLLLLISVSGNVGFWAMVGLLAACGLTLLWSLGLQIKKAVITPSHRLYSKDFSLKALAKVMGFFLILGTLQYVYVLYKIGHDPRLVVEFHHPVEISNMEYLLRSLICSLDLFMLDVDSNLLDRLDGHPALKGWIAVQAVFSFGCTVVMLIGLVYSRLHSYCRLNYGTKITNSRNHLYLFFGSNEPSMLLIKDIIKNDPKAIAVIIDEAKVKEDDHHEWEGIVGLIAHNPKTLKSAQKVGAYVAIASQKLVDIDSSITGRKDFDAFGYLGLAKIRKLISRLSATSDPQLHIFFMDKDEELNIRNVIVLAKDVTILDAAKARGLYHRIYCHARYNGPNRVIRDVALRKHLDIKIVDSSHIAIELLKLDPACHPVNVAHTSDKRLTTVASPFKALIVGFGEVGRDAFRFLYEFGAFVDSANYNIRSPFECTIVDNNLNNIQGTFMASMPGVFEYDSKKGKFLKKSIKFEKADYHSKKFYSKILLNRDFLKEVNYIVISIGNNDEAIALAARIFDQARKVREDISNLRIFVRCTDDDKVEGIQKIADHYNFGYGAGERNTPVIRIFGQPSKTYTYGLVVSDHLIELGKEFHEKYRKFSNDVDSWDERHKKLTETGTPDIELLRKLRRQESQDLANALHAGTKIKLLKEAMDALSKQTGTWIDWYSFYLRYFNADGSANTTGSKAEIRYPGLSDKENEIIRNLARLEHIRWNAAHELMGYVFTKDGTKCDERTMRHNCLCQWDVLDGQSEKQKGWPCDYKKYDFCVVDTTIALNKENLIYPEMNDGPRDNTRVD